MKTRKGFSLLELLIVVAIILIIATIAIPSLLRSRQAANEMAAVANLKALSAAQVLYSSSGNYGSLADLIGARLIDESFTSNKAGYKYIVEVSAADYTAMAVPINGNSGRYGYYILPDAVIRFSTDTALAPAGQTGRAVH